MAEPQLLGDRSKCRVFVTHRVPALDYSALDEFAATIHSIYLNSAFADQPDWAVSDGANRLKDLFDHYKFDPRTDYIALSGDVLRIGMVCALVGSLYKTVSFLRYDKQKRRYWAFYIDFTRGVGNNEQIRNKDGGIVIARG